MAMALQSTKGARAGPAMASPAEGLDRVPLKNGEYSMASRAVALSSYFLSGVLAINMSQFLGTPLYLVNEDWYNAWIAFTKQSFGLLTMTLTQAFAPTKVIVSGDASVRGQLKRRPDGNLNLDFPSRLVLMANHQIYTDWLYLWWIAYCNGMHGRLYIVLKESLKRIPVLGWGMQLSQFIFLKRNWEKDRPHMASALKKLDKITEPMWLLLFPEGTNLAPSTREKSAAWAKKTDIADMQHLLLPRSTGLQFCLQELSGTVPYLYDCTVAYEGVPRGQYAQDIFTLKAGYLDGNPPKSVSMYWRRFAVKDIPINNQKAFELWLTVRWREKDLLMEHYMKFGKFPADRGASKYKSGKVLRGAGHLEVQIRSSHWYEFLQIFAPMGVLAMVLAVFYGALPQRFWKAFNKRALQTGTTEIKKVGVQAGTQAKAISGSAASLTMDDFFDKNKQEESFKKGAIMVGTWLKTSQAQTLMNRVDFVTQFLQNPQKTVTETIKGQRKNFMKDIEEEETRRKKLKLPTSAQNVGPQKGAFWKDLDRLDKSRHGSVVTAPSSRPAGTFYAELQAAEQRKTGGLEYGAKGAFWDQVKAEENSRYGTVRTLSSNASTAVATLPSGYSTPVSSRKAPSSAPALTRRPSASTTVNTTRGTPPKLPVPQPKKTTNAVIKPTPTKAVTQKKAATNKTKTSNPSSTNKPAAPRLVAPPKKALLPAKGPVQACGPSKLTTPAASKATPKVSPTAASQSSQRAPLQTKKTPVKQPTQTQPFKPPAVSAPKPAAKKPPANTGPPKLASTAKTVTAKG